MFITERPRNSETQRQNRIINIATMFILIHQYKNIDQFLSVIQRHSSILSSRPFGVNIEYLNFNWNMVMV